jgi:hypothetical protein
MIWFFLIIFAYFLFAITAILDKYILKPEFLKPKVYTFYDGILGIIFVFLIFLKPFRINIYLILLSFLIGLLRILAVFIFYNTILKFETSRILPTIGAFLPCFTLFFSYFLDQNLPKEFTLMKFISFLFLILGSFLINLQKSKINFQAIKFSVLSSIFFSLYFIFLKILFSKTNFINGLIWASSAQGLLALIFLFSKEIQEEIFHKKKILNKNIGYVFLLDKGLGAIGGLLQNYAIFLTPFSFLAFINALEGLKYVFILLLTFFLSLKIPNILKEDYTKNLLILKCLSVIIIFIGIFLFYYK